MHDGLKLAALVCHLQRAATSAGALVASGEARA
jgi:hypothetical protein